MLGVSVGPSKDQLKRMKKHIVYEYVMLLHSAKKYVELDRDKTSDVLDKNAYLECFLLHLRALDEFFSFKRERKSEKKKKSKKNKRDDDVLASHYSEQKYKSLLTKKQRENVNKRLAHITSKRLKRKKYKWPIVDFIKKAEASWKKFEEIT